MAFVAISLYLALTTPTFLTTANMLSILLATSLIGIVAMGETFVIVTGGIDLSPGSVVALTGVCTGLLLHAHVPGCRWRSRAASCSARPAGPSTASPSRC